jgi:amino acid transporter
VRPDAAGQYKAVALSPPDAGLPPTGLPPGAYVLPEPLSYRLKKLLLGEPLVTERLSEEKLSKTIALGVLSPDCISSTAYGTEEMLNQLVPFVGLAAFSLLLPITGAILLVLLFVTLSYREVVMVYTKAGGSYVVSRDNFGPRVAQIAAVALIIDYILTVCVQTSAGTDALTSAFPVLGEHDGGLYITVAVVVLITWGNLRGIREAGRMFALPTYLFIFSIGALVAIGVGRLIAGDLPVHSINRPGVDVGHHTLSGLAVGFAVLMILRSFANGGSSLTGLEAISNGVANFRRPNGPNARRVLVIMSATLGTLVLGVSLIAWHTHAVPYAKQVPTVISQEAHFVFGYSIAGKIGFYFVQFATMLILYTGANTSFNGFPNLASFVAEDAYLPRQLTRRGHRLVFSNGIIILAVVSSGLLIATNASVNALVAMYAIGVFVGFTMAGAGMVKHHLTNHEQGWRYKIWINGFAAVLSALIVLILAVVKFTQGAWLVVALFPILIGVLIRLHKQYTIEKEELEQNAGRAAAAPVLRHHTVLVFVERLDLATARALQYARTLQPDELRAVHFVLDTEQAAHLQNQWSRLGLARFPLDLVECPDRRLTRASMELVAEATEDGRTEVSVLLPRRVFEGAWRRVLHDRTADRIAGFVSQLPNANATIVPFPLGKRRRELVPWRGSAEATSAAAAEQYLAEGDEAEHGRRRMRPGGGHPWNPAETGRLPRSGEGGGESRRALRRAAAEPSGGGGAANGAGGTGGTGEPERPEAARGRSRGPAAASSWGVRQPGVARVGDLRGRQRAKVQGRVRSVRVQAGAGVPSVECVLADETGQLMLVFQGRRRVPGIEPGARLLVEGMVGERGRRTVMINPMFTILRTADGEGEGS